MEKTILRIGNEKVCLPSELPLAGLMRIEAHKLENPKASSIYD
jgi:hypothetical protein